jgi:hypothetical protein
MILSGDAGSNRGVGAAELVFVLSERHERGR